MPSAETRAALARARARVDERVRVHLPPPHTADEPSDRASPSAEGFRRCEHCGDAIPTHWPSGKRVIRRVAERRLFCSTRCRALAREADKRIRRRLGLHPPTGSGDRPARERARGRRP